MGLVYSTDKGRVCPSCGQAQADCRCKALAALRPLGDGVVRVSRETGGRKGKAVTLIKGLPLDDAALQALAKQLKAACGSGGTVKDGVVEIQGEHIEKVMTWLAARPECKAQGWKLKRAGG
ncbi:MAG: translation initiation factor Sui1 [Inhella sp.]|jgi:translation initiation factor 1